MNTHEKLMASRVLGEMEKQAGILEKAKGGVDRYGDLLTGRSLRNLKLVDAFRDANKDHPLHAVMRKSPAGAAKLDEINAALDQALSSEGNKVLATRLGTGLGAVGLLGGAGYALGKRKKRKEEEQD